MLKYIHAKNLCYILVIIIILLIVILLCSFTIAFGVFICPCIIKIKIAASTLCTCTTILYTLKGRCHEIFASIVVVQGTTFTLIEFVKDSNLKLTPPRKV
jgi:cellulose synthase/poly-beta-1,6-N-acetylglucosamine synthase-like glycosyltransferase